MDELDELADERIRAALHSIGVSDADPSRALPAVLARGRARRARTRAAVGATATASVLLALVGLALAPRQAGSSVSTDPSTPVTAEAAVTYGFEASKPLVDGVLPVAPKTTLAVVDGHTFSAEVTATALTYSLTDATGGGGGASGDPQTIPALTFSGQGPASNDPSPATYIMGVTRFEVARIDLMRGDDVVSVQTIANDTFPDLRFFIIADKEGPWAGSDAATGVPLLVAYDSQGEALTDSERVLAAQRSIQQEEEQRQQQESVVAEPYGETAVWSIDSDRQPSRVSDSFTAMVSRLGCSGGETGEVTGPTITAEEARIVVEFTVEPLTGDFYSCQGNDEVPYLVELNEPIGDRQLVDGACLSGEAASTSFCADGAVRWRP